MTEPLSSAVANSLPPRALLRALGGLTLEPLDGSDANETEARALQELASRRRKVALLLYLAGQTRPVSRELLATLFWSEEPPERARHNLAEALSHIRRAFGRDAIASRVQDVELAAHCPIRFDVREFEAALSNGDSARAVECYAGPFLAGVFLERAPGFDDWTARERARLSGCFVSLCRTRVPQLMAEGRATEAVALGEQWLDEDVEDADAAIALLAAIAAPGTRTALRDAIERYRRLKARLHAEFESEPDARVDALSVEHAAAMAALPARRASEMEVVATVARTGASAGEYAGADTGVAPTAHASVKSPTAAAVSSSRRFGTIVVGAAAVLVAVAAWVVLRPRRGASSAPALVLVADTQDPARDAVTSASVTMALGVTLAQGAQINVVPRERVREVLQLMRLPDSTFIDERTALDIAMRLGAGRVVVPSIARLGPQRSLSARVLDVATGTPISVEQSSAESDEALLPALDKLSRAVQRRLGASLTSSVPVRPLPEVTTASLGALRAYTRANGYSRAGNYDSAMTEYRRAIALDSSFATAHSALGQLQYLLNRPAEGEASIAGALSLRARLSAREAMRTEALQARWRRLPDSAIAIQERWLASYPLDRDTRSSLAFDLLQGRRSAAARDLYVQLLKTDSLDARDWINLAAAANSLDSDADRTTARRAFARAFALDPSLRTDVVQNNEYGSALVRAGFPDSAAAVFRLMIGGSAGQSARGYRSLGLLALWRDDARTAVTMFDSAALTHQAMKTESLGEVRARLMLAWARGLAGDSAGVRKELERVRAVSRSGVSEPTVLYWAGKAMARVGMADAAREMLDTLGRRAVKGNARHESAALLLRGEVAVARGQARSAIPLMERGVALDSTPVPQESLAHAVRQAGEAARADSIARTLAATLRFGTEAMLAQQLAARQLRAAKP